MKSYLDESIADQKMREGILHKNIQRNEVGDYKVELAKNIFSEINPSNLPLPQLKIVLENDIVDIRLKLDEFRENKIDIEALSDEERSLLYDYYSKKLQNNFDWIQRINDFLIISETNSIETDPKLTPSNPSLN